MTGKGEVQPKEGGQEMAGGGKLGQSKKERWAGEGDSAKKTGYGNLIAAEKVVRGKMELAEGYGSK